MLQKEKRNNIHFFVFLYIFHFLLFQVNSQALNSIINLTEYSYRYNHFSFNSNGDMIVDTKSYPVKPTVKFFGIRKDGRKLFFNNCDDENYYSSLDIPNSGIRVEGESLFVKVKINNISYSYFEEYLIGISKNYHNMAKTEFYYLDNRKIIFEFNFNSYDIFGSIINDVFSILPDPLNDSVNNDYYISYISYVSTLPQGNFKFVTIKINFHMPILSSQISYNKELIEELEAIEQVITSCFFTKNNIYTCFYINNELNLIIWSFDILKPRTGFSTIIHIFTQDNYKRFFKGIHFKNEIGFFSYFKDNENNPTFCLYNINYNNSLTIYKSYRDIKFTKGTFYNYHMLNDLIKLNNNNICFLGASSNRKEINILIFYFYDDDNFMNIRYYKINIWEENGIKIFFDIKINLYNNFLVMAFSHCFQEFCDHDQDPYLSSLIFFNYINSTDKNFDIINYIYKDNKNIENDIIINFEDNLTIQNNIFGYIFKGTKIISYSNKINIRNCGYNTINNEMINPREFVQIKFKNNGVYVKGNYTIEYAYILTEPDFGAYNQYLLYINETLGNKIKDEKEYYKKYEYIGKASTFTLIIRENLTNICNEDFCSLCYESENTCITCKYIFDYNENNNTKTCYNLPIESNKIDISSIHNSTFISTQINEKGGRDNYIFNDTATEGIKDKNKNITNILPDEISNKSKCTNEEIFSGKCGLDLSREQIQSFYEDIKCNIKVNNSQIISTKNAIFQISTLNNQKKDENLNISTINLGDC